MPAMIDVSNSGLVIPRKPAGMELFPGEPACRENVSRKLYRIPKDSFQETICFFWGIITKEVNRYGTFGF